MGIQSTVQDATLKITRLFTDFSRQKNRFFIYKHSPSQLELLIKLHRIAIYQMSVWRMMAIKGIC